MTMGALSTWIAKTAMTIVKGQPSSSNVHVAGPLQIKRPVKKTDQGPPIDNLEATILKAALGAYEAPEQLKAGAQNDPAAPTSMPTVLPSAAGRRIATVGVRHGDHLLMGKRRDNGKWTVPGGHVDYGEDFHAGALRELKEETGIEASPEDLKALHPPVTKKAHGGGDTIQVQPFSYDLAERPKTSMRADPDGEVHRWNWVDVSEGLPKHIEKDLHVPAEHNTLLHALDLAQPGHEDGDAEPPAHIDDLAELISGMDWEMGEAQAEDGERLDPEEARSRAIENLETDPDYYRDLRSTAVKEGDHDPFGDDGLCIDLASGQAREPGFLGVDTYPYDHGTLVHDVTQGLPFPDQSASTIQIRNAPIDELNPDDSAYDLFGEIQRTLKPGGTFVYQGNEPLPENLFPGLELTRHDVDQVQKEGPYGDAPAWHRQYYTSVDPATANDAQQRINPGKGDDYWSADERLAQLALGYYWNDATGAQAVMRPQTLQIQKSGKGEVGTRLARIIKASAKKQIVYCVVLSPEEMDEDEDFMLADDIERACHFYMENSRVIGSNHTTEIKACPVECYCAPVNFEMDGGPYGPQAVKKGSWVIGIKVYDPAEWAKVEDGTYQGVSVSGFGHRDKMQMN